MKKTIAGAAALFLLAGCGQQSTPEPEAAAEAAAQPGSGIDLSYIDPNISPGDDFFAHVNGKWVEEFEIPADKSNYGTFTKLSDAAEEDVKAIVEMSATGDFAKGTDEQKVGDLYKSYLDTETRNAQGMAPLQPELRAIDSAGIESLRPVRIVGYRPEVARDQHVERVLQRGDNTNSTPHPPEVAAQQARRSGHRA